MGTGRAVETSREWAEERIVRTFLERWTMAGPTHHFALGVGHVADQVERLARYLGIECVRVA